MLENGPSSQAKVLQQHTRLYKKSIYKNHVTSQPNELGSVYEVYRTLPGCHTSGQTLTSDNFSWVCLLYYEIDCLLSTAINQKRPYLCEIQCSYNKRSDAKLHKYLTSTSRNDTAVAYGANEM